jgi:hypothetical protein
MPITLTHFLSSHACIFSQNGRYDLTAMAATARRGGYSESPSSSANDLMEQFLDGSWEL